MPGYESGSGGAASRGSALPVAGCACALVAGLVAAKATRDALFLTTFPASTLPRIMTASAIASVAAVLLMARAMARSSPRRVLTFGLGIAAALVLLEWGLTFVMPRVAAVVVHLHVAIFGATLLSAFWSMTNERFDPYTAKRVMGRIGAGAALGGIVGGGLAYLAARSLPVPSMLLSVALLDVLAFALVLRLPASGRARSPRAAADAPPAPVNLMVAVRILREGSYLRHLAGVVFLGAFMESLLDYAFNAEAAASLPRGPRLASFFAAYQTGVSVFGLLAQSLVARRSLETLGLSGTVSLRPVAVALSSLGALFDPRLFTLLLARGGNAVLTSSLFRSGYELLFTPVPAESKRPTKAIIDVGFDKLGSVMGGVVTLAVVGLAGQAEVRVLLVLVILAALLSFLVTSWLNAGYVRALEESLRSGAIRLEPDEVKDATTRFFYTRAESREALPSGLDPSLTGPPPEADPLLEAIADLRSRHRTRVLRALPAGQDPDPCLVPFLIPLLAQDSVLGEVVKALRRVADRATGQLLDALLDPRQEPVVRRRIPRVLVAAPTPRVAEGLLHGLDDARFDVRARCGLALLRIHERNPEAKVPPGAAFAAALRELQREPPAEGGEGVLGTHEEVVDHVFLLLSLVLEREPMQIASRALRSDDRALIGTALEYLETVLSDDLRRALWKRLQVRVNEGAPARPSQEALDQLLRSSYALKASRRPRSS